MVLLLVFMLLLYLGFLPTGLPGREAFFFENLIFKLPLLVTLGDEWCHHKQMPNEGVVVLNISKEQLLNLGQVRTNGLKKGRCR